VIGVLMFSPSGDLVGWAPRDASLTSSTVEVWC